MKKCIMLVVLMLCVANVYAELTPPTANLLTWFKADGTVTVDESAGVSVWGDMSGNGNDAYNTTMDLGDSIYTAQKPVLIQNAVNNLPAVRFSNGSGATSTLMQTTPGAGMINGQTGLAVFVVAKNRTGGDGAGDGVMLVGAARDGGGSSGYGGAGNWFNIATGEYLYNQGPWPYANQFWGLGDWANSTTMFYNSGIHTAIWDQPPVDTTKFHLQSMIWNGGLTNYYDGLTTLSLGLDGDQITVNAGGLWTIQEMDNLDIGGYDHLGHIYGPSLFDSGTSDIAEILIYESHSNSGVLFSAEMVDAVNEYLMTKYAIPEPATMVLLGLGAISMIRRRNA